MTQISVSHCLSKQLEEKASELEENAFRSNYGLLWWYGIQNLPQVQYSASEKAAKIVDLKVKHLEGVKTKGELILRHRPVIKFRGTDKKQSILVVFSEASFAPVAAALLPKLGLIDL